MANFCRVVLLSLPHSKNLLIGSPAPSHLKKVHQRCQEMEDKAGGARFQTIICTQRTTPARRSERCFFFSVMQMWHHIFFVCVLQGKLAEIRVAKRQYVHFYCSICSLGDERKCRAATVCPKRRCLTQILWISLAKCRV